MNIKDLLKDWKDGNLKEDRYATTDEDKNNVIIEVTDDYLKLITCQKNGWLRINHYYSDGTVDETYEK